MAQSRRLIDVDAAGLLFAPLARARTEVVAFAYLAADHGLLGLRHTRSPRPDGVALTIRDVAAQALALDAAAVVMAHNHPSGDPTPSTADRDATRRIAHALATLEVRLLDHLVVAARGTASFRRLGLL
ncbi:MAG: DNA repair protein [Sphingomonas sp.]|uniref:JAB domain-containing protein n=1 Tax=Sphingomonas sp. TaxID=28214 RepID=UPI001B201FD5|nr:JAB domain-containing protein [Sphingomonas sp.]MBO9622149.1 DNA repair protein [Sphingomonas sp.]